MRAKFKAWLIRRRMIARCDHMDFIVENLAHGKLLLTKLEQQQVRDQGRLWSIEQPQALMGSRVRA